MPNSVMLKHAMEAASFRQDRPIALGRFVAYIVHAGGQSIKGERGESPYW
jgi:hypothetical protein